MQNLTSCILSFGIQGFLVSQFCLICNCSKRPNGKINFLEETNFQGWKYKKKDAHKDNQSRDNKNYIKEPQLLLTEQKAKF